MKHKLGSLVKLTRIKLGLFKSKIYCVGQIDKTHAEVLPFKQIGRSEWKMKNCVSEYLFATAV